MTENKKTVAIIGAGIMGVSTAVWLQRAGHEVILIDRKAPGEEASGGNGGILKAVAGGQSAYGVIVDYLPIREAAKGSPVNFVFPTEGVSAVTEPVAILKTAKNPEAAKAFVDFLLSEEGQKLAATQGYLPARDGVAGPAGFPARAEIKLMSFDAEKALADEEANKKRFAEIFGG